MTIKYNERGTDYGGDIRTLGSCNRAWRRRWGGRGERNEFLEDAIPQLRSEKSGEITVAEIGS